MTDPMRFPLPPSANRYWRQGRFGRVYVSDEAQAYKQEVALMANLLGVQELQGAIAMDIDVYRKDKRSDIDNFEKVLLDSLQGVLYENDQQVCDIHIRRFDDKKDPHVSIWAYEVAEPRRRGDGVS